MCLSYLKTCLSLGLFSSVTLFPISSWPSGQELRPFLLPAVNLFCPCYRQFLFLLVKVGIMKDMPPYSLMKFTGRVMDLFQIISLPRLVSASYFLLCFCLCSYWWLCSCPVSFPSRDPTQGIAIVLCFLFKSVWTTSHTILILLILL